MSAESNRYSGRSSIITSEFKRYMHIHPDKLLPASLAKQIIVIFYAVGVAGFMIPWSRDIFVTATPFALLLSILLLALYHVRYTRKSIVVFIVIAVLGYIIEAVGVNTGIIFGNYRYGNALGYKVFDTPLLIALNWLFLTYTAASVADAITRKPFIQLFIVPTIMLVYDLILERLAPLMDMWSWSESVVPARNYIAWWIIGFMFIGLIRVSDIETKNPLSVVLFISQFAFFITLYVLYSWFFG